MEQTVTFDSALLQRYDTSGPRYTSYPTAPQFNEQFTAQDYIQLAKQSNEEFIPQPLSLYFHIPFCDTVCFYCGCSKIASKNHGQSPEYLQRLIKEIQLQAELFDHDRTVEQLHWGGGTPTFLNNHEISSLMQATRSYFNLRDDDKGEYSIEIDPRKANAETISLLRDLGFNRLSLGVQDFSIEVQQAVNRIQSEQETFLIIDAARRNAFKSINIDLIYGLPLQTTKSFAKTIDKVIAADPDRLAIYSYAHLPNMFKPQRRINENELPSATEKLSILQMTIEKLTNAGYIYIGMDHFAKPNDELAIAQRNRSLHRNFQGYSSHLECDLVAIGITSIGKIGKSYSQNVKTLDEYYKLIDANRLPVYRGYMLDNDDILRRDIISELICYSQLNIPEIEQRYEIVFNSYFASALDELEIMQNDGLLTIEYGKILVKPVGRLLLRNIVMVFDRYLTNKTNTQFSKVI